MDFAYEDIMKMQRPAHTDDPFSRRHPKMARLNRAKLFAPFAALAGFEECVRSKETPYVPRRAPDAEEARELNRVLNLLSRATRRDGIEVRAVYFEVCADPRHEACGRDGLYRVASGIVRRADPVLRVLTIGDRTLSFDDIDSLIIMN